MSVERLVRRVFNVGKEVQQGVVSEVGLKEEVYRRIVHPTFFFGTFITGEIAEVSAFKVKLPNGSTRTLRASEALPVDVGDKIEFGERIAMWSKID